MRFKTAAAAAQKTLPPHYVSDFFTISFFIFFFPRQESWAASLISLLVFFSLKFLRRPSQIAPVAPIKMQRLYSTTCAFPSILEGSSKLEEDV